MEQNYLPLFRKYRPQSFEDIVGQESLVKALSNAIELNRIANAYLFCGPRGTGKTSTARILAKSLNCEHGPTLHPCQKCASCIDITNAAGLDVIEIDAASNRGIQDAKELISQVHYAPINGKYKIFIIDEVHMLSTDAFNALLKTFEEPPKNVIFILATTEPHKVLETIVSRCQRFDLRRITTDDIIKRLREISDKENIKITDEALFTIAKNVSGGLRDSLALLDQVSILGVKEEITKDLIEELLGKINFDTMLELLDKIYSKDIEASLVCVDNIYLKGSEPRNLAENFIEFLRNIILVINSDNFETIKKFTTLVDDDIKKIKKRQDENFDKDKIIKILNTLIEYYKEIKVSTNPYLWMELAVIGACRLDLTNLKPQAVSQIPQNSKAIAFEIQKPVEIKKQPEVQNSIETQNHAENDLNHAEISVDKTNNQVMQSNIPKETIVPPEVAQNQDSAQIWANILAAIKSIPTRALFQGVAKLVGIKDNKLVLGFLNDDTMAKSRTSSKFDMLKEAISSTYPNLEPEFIRINQDTKVISVKPQSRQVFNNQQQNMQNSPQQFSNPQKVLKEENTTGTENEDSEERAHEAKNYSPKVRDMLEQFSGKIIED